MEKSVQNHSLPCCPAEFAWGSFSENLCLRARGWNSAAQDEGSRSQRRDREEAGAYRDQQRSVLSAAFFTLLSTVTVASELTLSLCLFALPSVPRLHYGCLPLLSGGKDSSLQKERPWNNCLAVWTAGLPAQPLCISLNGVCPSPRASPHFPLTALQSGMHLWNSPKQASCASYSTGWFSGGVAIF